MTSLRIVTMTVKPRSKKDLVEVVTDDEFVIYTKSDPIKGKANKEALKLLARHLGIAPSQLMLTKGEKFQVKTVLVME